MLDSVSHSLPSIFSCPGNISTDCQRPSPRGVCVKTSGQVVTASTEDSRECLRWAQCTKDFSPSVPVGRRCRATQDLLNTLDQKERVLPLALL